MIEPASWQARALQVPPAVLLAGSLALCAASPAAWGAGREHGLPGFLPTAVALQYGVPGVVVGAACLASVRARISRRFEVAPFHLLAGLLLLLAGLAAVGFIPFLDEARFYAPLAAEDANAKVDAGEAVASTLVGAALVSLTNAGIAFIYSRGITPSRPSRWDKRPGEPDAMGEILRRGLEGR